MWGWRYSGESDNGGATRVIAVKVELQGEGSGGGATSAGLKILFFFFLREHFSNILWKK